MFLYQAYGLIFASAVPLPELAQSRGMADVFIELRAGPCVASIESAPIALVDASSDRVHLAWGGVGDLVVENGKRIALVPLKGAEEASLRLFILGAGIGVLLHQIGVLVFHASAVAIDAGVVGFLGGKGLGKSTLAASFNGANHALVSDELLVIRFDCEGRAMAYPGSSQIRLWSDVLENAGGIPDSAVRVRSGVDKYSVNGGPLASAPLPFRVAYLLGVGSETHISFVEPGEALLHLVPHLYVSRFGNSLLKADRKSVV